jgi:hypothetical protein
MKGNYVDVLVIVVVLVVLVLIIYTTIMSFNGPKCTPANARSSSVTKAPTVDGCIRLCGSYGLGWKTEIIGQDPDKGLLHCNCYAC